MSADPFDIIMQRIEWLIDGKKIKDQKSKTVKIEEFKTLLKAYGEQCRSKPKSYLEMSLEEKAQYNKDIFDYLQQQKF